jgi:Ca2+-binding EF-hand superfamily protein
LRAIFKSFDLDGDGEVTAEEMKSALATMGQQMSEEAIGLLMALLDEDGSGSVSYEEFLSKAADLDIKLF